MADYIVSARKYRPATFNTVVGQRALVQTLKNAIASGKLAHAYLFCGPRGVGKTTCARIFAKTINCEHRTPEGEACDQCESCQSFREQRSYNVYELDAASNNSVDNIRELIDQVQIPPQIGKYKVFIIDEVHMLSTAAFNAFLKTLEEPPKHAIFVMCTTEKQKILPTILSRCQTYDFQRISLQDIVDQLAYIASQEQINAEPQALQVIARKADGGMRDALSVFDQISSFTSGNVTYQATIDNLNILDYELFFRITNAALQGNVPAALMMLDEVIRRGFDPQYFIGGWAGHLRDLMVAQDPATLQLIEAGPEIAQHYKEQAAQCSPYFLYNAVMIANDCDFNYRNSRNKRLSVEIAIVRICQLLHPVQQPQQPQKAQMQPLNGTPTSPVQGQQIASPRPVVPQAAQQPVGVQPQQPVASQQPIYGQQQAVTPRPGYAQQLATAQPRGAQPMAQQPNNTGYQQAQQPMSSQGQPMPANRPPVVQRGAGLPGRTGMMASLRTTTAAPVATSQATPVQQQVPEQNEPVDEPALKRMWKQYIQTIPEEKLLQTALQNSEVQLREGIHIGVTVHSDEQSQRITESRGLLLNFLRSNLRNSKLELSIAVAAGSDVKLAFTPRERMAEMRDEHQELVDSLVDTFGLELS